MPSSIVAELQTNLGIGESGKEDQTEPVKREPAVKQQTGAVRRDQVPPKPEVEKVSFIRRILRFVFGKTSPADRPPDIPKSLSPEQVASSNEAVNAAKRRILAREMRAKESVDTVAAPQTEPPQGLNSGTRIEEVLRVTLVGGEMYHVLASDLARAETDQSLWVPLCDAAGNHLPRDGSNSPPSLLLSSVRSGRIDAMPDLLPPVVSVDDSAAQRLYLAVEDPNQKPTEQGQKL